MRAWLCIDTHGYSVARLIQASIFSSVYKRIVLISYLKPGEIAEFVYILNTGIRYEWRLLEHKSIGIASLRGATATWQSC